MYSLYEFFLFSLQKNQIINPCKMYLRNGWLTNENVNVFENNFFFKLNIE